MSKTPEQAGMIDVTIMAGPIEATGNHTPRIGHQLRMDGIGAQYTHLYINPDVAAQWIETLTPIAKEANPDG